MISNELLEEKWRTQKELAKEASYDIEKMLDIIDSDIKKLVEIHGISLKFADIKPGYLKKNSK